MQGSLVTGVAMILCLFGGQAQAATGSAQGTVQYIYTYGDGMVLVTGFYFSTATCTNNGGFFIAGNHPNNAKLVAQILAAKAMGTTLQVIANVDNCWYPEIGTTAANYIVAFPT